MDQFMSKHFASSPAEPKAPEPAAPAVVVPAEQGIFSNSEHSFIFNSKSKDVTILDEYKTIQRMMISSWVP